MDRWIWQLLAESNHSFAGMKSIPKEELYKLQFISLDSQSTIRKVIDRVLTRYGIDPKRLKIEMELNSIEAIKNAVQAGLGAAFVSLSAIEREIENATLHRAHVDGVEIKRMLSVIVNPNRYRSKAAEAFAQEILPDFTTYPWDAGKLFAKRVKAEIDIEEESI
jgi:DNA-binding transcriptional LysR family regulator